MRFFGPAAAQARLARPRRAGCADPRIPATRIGCADPRISDYRAVALGSRASRRLIPAPDDDRTIGSHPAA